jgi:hypothetical protein
LEIENFNTGILADFFPVNAFMAFARSFTALYDIA